MVATIAPIVASSLRAGITTLTRVPRLAPAQLPGRPLVGGPVR